MQTATMDTNKAKTLIIYNIILDEIARSLLVPALPGFYDRFGANTAAIGTLTSFLALLSFLFGAVQGIISDYFGRIRMLQICAVFQLLGFIFTIYGVCNNIFWIFVLSRSLPKLLKCCMLVSQAYLFDMDTEQNLRGNGDVVLLTAYSSVASIAGPLIGGWLTSYRWHYPCILGVMICVAELIMLSQLEEPIQKVTTQTAKQSSESKLDDRANGGQLLDLLQMKFAYTMSYSLFESMFPQYGRSQFGLTGYAVGLCSSFTGVLSAIVNMYALPWVLQLPAPEQYLASILVATCAGLMVWVYWGSITGLVVATFLVTVTAKLFLGILQNGIVESMKQPVSVTQSNSTVSKDGSAAQGGSGATTFKSQAGAVFGFSATADRAARVVAPLLGGLLIQHYGSAGLALLCCVSVIYCAVLLAWKAPHVIEHRKVL